MDKQTGPTRDSKGWKESAAPHVVAKKFRNPVISPALTWKCTDCAFILGYTDSTKTELRVKFKDYYVTITRADRVDTVCRRCAKMNSVTASS